MTAAPVANSAPSVSGRKRTQAASAGRRRLKREGLTLPDSEPRRCRTVRGRAYCGSGAAKRAQCFGWRRQLLCTAAGVPVACDVLPAGVPDRTPVQE